MRAVIYNLNKLKIDYKYSITIDEKKAISHLVIHVFTLAKKINQTKLITKSKKLSVFIQYC